MHCRRIFLTDCKGVCIVGLTRGNPRNVIRSPRHLGARLSPLWRTYLSGAVIIFGAEMAAKETRDTVLKDVQCPHCKEQIDIFLRLVKDTWLDPPRIDQWEVLFKGEGDRDTQ